MAGAAAHPRDGAASQWLAARVARAAAAASPEDAVAALFADTGWLADLAAAWLAPMDAAGGAPALPAMRNGPVVNLTLAAAPPVLLLLTLIDGAAERPDLPPAAGPAIGFSGVRAFYRLLSPQPVTATLGRLARDGQSCRTRPVRLQPGRTLALDERRFALRIAPQESAVLLLRARIARRPAPPVRHFALDDGRRLATVQGDDGFARTAMLLSVLRALDHRAAVPEMLALLDRTRGRARWTVMRELLALDSTAVWPRLARMAADEPDAALRHVAGAVLARHGALMPDSAPCPA